jgi:hypothetical protein
MSAMMDECGCLLRSHLDLLSMNSTMCCRINGTPIEWLYAPKLPIDWRSDLARWMTSLGKSFWASGWSMRSGYSVRQATYNVHRISSQSICHMNIPSFGEVVGG